jgi:protein-tyrosine phosphatase
LPIVPYSKAYKPDLFRWNCAVATKLLAKEFSMPSILFVCTANRFRSPLAAAMLRKSLEELGIAEAWTIASAGTWGIPGEPAIPEVVVPAGRFGIQLSDHRSRRVSEGLLSTYDLILVMQAGQKEALLSEFPPLKERVYLLSEVVERRTYDIPDALGSEQETAEVVAELHSLIERGLDSICILATYLHNTRSKTEPYSWMNVRTHLKR